MHMDLGLLDPLFETGKHRGGSTVEDVVLKKRYRFFVPSVIWINESSSEQTS